MSMFVHAVWGQMKEIKNLLTKSGEVCVPEVLIWAKSGVMGAGMNFPAPKCRQQWRVFWLLDAAANLHYRSHIRVEMEKVS